MTERERGAKDQRTRRTRGLLHEALSSLIHEKSYDAISVRDILTRASVGRSTFYMHFDDKDDLLVASLREVLGRVESAELPSTGGPYERIIGFSLPVLEHICQHRGTDPASGVARKHAVVHEHLERVLADWIANGLRKDAQRRGRTSDPVASDLLARYLASTFILVLGWWLEGRTPMLPREADGLFRSLAVPTLIATWR